MLVRCILYIYVCSYVFVCPKCPPSGRDRRRGMALAPPNLCHVCPCWYHRRRLTLPQSYGHIALGGVLPCRGPGLRLLRTQPHSCRRCCSVWPCGWHGMLLCTQPPPVAHCGLTALYAMLYVGVTMLVPLTRKLWGSGPCGITKPLFHSRWKPI